MFQFLFQPYPSQKNIKHTIFMSCIAGACIFAIFYFAKPFGLSKYTNAQVAIKGIQYGGVTLVLSLLCTTIVPLSFPTWFNEKHWKVWHEILFLFLMLLIIALGNVWLTAYIYNMPINAFLFLNMLKYTIAFGMAPIVISVLIKQQNLLHKYSTEAKQIEALLVANPIETTPAKFEPVTEQPIITPIDALPQDIALIIKGNNQTEQLNLTEKDFIFAEAADNYTAINYLLAQSAKQVLYRMSIKNVELQTAQAPQVFRCHKSYLVNLTHVQHISGNAQGYKLKLLNSKVEIPVSRTLNAIIKEKLANLLPQKA